MVCNRCKIIVKSELEKLGLHCTVVELGQVETLENISTEKKGKFQIALLEYGLELLENKKDILIEKIKRTIVEMVSYSDCQLKSNFSDYLSAKLNLDYTYLANVFSERQGTTIEHFIIINKILRIKQLINYDELNLTEISWKLHYSSVAHLSAQFKKITGLTPSHFRHLHRKSNFATQNV
jgi:YesN/AraC family two-component response regulator